MAYLIKVIGTDDLERFLCRGRKADILNFPGVKDFEFRAYSYTYFKAAQKKAIKIAQKYASSTVLLYQTNTDKTLTIRGEIWNGITLKQQIAITGEYNTEQGGYNENPD